MQVPHVHDPNRKGSSARLRARKVVARFRPLLADLWSACRDSMHIRSSDRRESTPDRASPFPTRFVTAVCAIQALLSPHSVSLLENPTFVSLLTPFQFINHLRFMRRSSSANRGSDRRGSKMGFTLSCVTR